MLITNYLAISNICFVFYFHMIKKTALIIDPYQKKLTFIKNSNFKKWFLKNKFPTFAIKSYLYGIN